MDTANKHNVFQYYQLTDGAWECRECKTVQELKPGTHAENCQLGRQEKENDVPWLRLTDTP